MIKRLFAAVAVLLAAMALPAIDLNGVWAFDFREGKTLEDVSRGDFRAQAAMNVPGCWDVQPEWYLKRGTGCYRRTFTVERPLREALLVVEGMGVRAKFSLDGKDLGVHPYPYARLEIPLGELAVGEHELYAAIDNIMEWPRVKLARPYYDFYLYGGFYHGVKIVEKEPRVLVRTLDWRTRTLEIELDGADRAELELDGAALAADWRDGRTRVQAPGAALWSPEAPNLHTLKARVSAAGGVRTLTPVSFGIRQIEARGGKILLNGKAVFLKGVNRHESSPLEGSATSAATMLRDLQNLKALGGNFIRAAHYQQCSEFLALCDRLGVLVWEESLGWGNGQRYVNGNFPPSELSDPEFCAMQIRQTREMVRASFNHPSVIVYAFLNECNSTTREGKALVDRLIETIRAERPGRLVSFACNLCRDDIAHANTDLVAFNAYPGTIPAAPGTPDDLRKKVEEEFNGIVAHFRKLYPEKPIIISESGCGGAYGWRDANKSINTEDYQDEYLEDILRTLWRNPDVSGFALWQMNDGRTRERYCQLNCSTMFGGSVAGIFDVYRRPKKSVATVRRYFETKAAGEAAD